MIIKVKNITAEATIIIRHQVLRIGQPMESCWFDGDLLDSTIHIGLQLDNIVVGVISAYNKKTDLFTENNQYQIRGMAVLIDHQKKGFGEKLIDFAENELKLLTCNLIWFNARTSAIGFYQKMNYTQIGTPFNIEKVGEHVVMFKKILA